MKLRILIACEESQEVCKAFRARGHEAYSCDLQACSGGHPEWHMQMDCFEAITRKAFEWDLIIMHPPCTALAVSGNAHYGNGKPRHQERIKAISWTINLWDTACAHCDKVVLENPVSVIFQYLDGGTLQYIQPHQFGHGEVKKTGLLVRGLPHLNPTDHVEGRESRVWKMGPSKDRQKLRSKTFPGIARAMAEQWG